MAITGNARGCAEVLVEVAVVLRDELGDHVQAIDALLEAWQIDPALEEILDHLEPLVEERRRIDGDLAAHDPARVFQRALDGYVGEGFFRVQRLVAEGTAAGGEPEAADGGTRLAIQTLEDGGVLAVHGEDFHAVLAGFVHHGFAGHD